MLVGTSAVTVFLAVTIAFLRLFFNEFKIPSMIVCCSLTSVNVVVLSFLESTKSFNFATAVDKVSWSDGANCLIWSIKLAGSSTVALSLAVSNTDFALDTASSKSPSALFKVSVFKSAAFKTSLTTFLAAVTASESETFASTIVSTAV